VSSWHLLRTLLFTPAHHTVYQREKNYPPLWNHVPDLMRNILSVPLIIFPILYVAAFLYAPGTYMSACVCLPLLFLLLPSLFPWSVPLSIALAPTIAREREQGTWETLRISPIRTETLVLEKAAGALWRIRYMLRRLAIILIFTAVGLGVLSALTIYRQFPILNPAAVFMLSIISGMIIFLIDRAQQFALMIAAALAGSSLSTSVRSAISSALLAALGMWLLDVCSATLILTFLGKAPIYPALSARYLMLFTFGSAGAYLLDLHPLWAGLLISLTFLVRELLLRVLWYLTLRAAERL